ncbi:MAG TPA: hypothetical protein VHO46_00905 [Bacteroidales bacterium]|nr:hypothetical protein [Bacteroidales bacterium]
MKKFVICAFFFFLTDLIYSQQECKVLLPSIIGKYTGECRQGLAHGFGESTGIDFYRGQFVKGLPQGIGKYIWKDGSTFEGEWKKGVRDGEGVYTIKTSGRDSVVKGFWKDDKFIGTRKSETYHIDYQNNIQRVTCQRTGDRPYIRYQFYRAGGQAYQILSNIMLQGSSGNENNSPQFTGFEEISFPFKGKIMFTAPNLFNATTFNSEVQITLFEPGSWLITITF